MAMVDHARPDPSQAAVAALAAGERLGPFFAVSSNPEPEADWRGLPELCDVEVLAERVEQLRAKLAGPAGHPVQQRVAGSVLSQGVFARLVSPLLGAVLTQGILPTVGPETLWWQSVPSGPLPVAMTPTGTSWKGDARTREGLRSLAAAFEWAVLGPLVEPLVAAFRRMGVSPVVLKGNVVSAVGGALTMLNRDEGWALLKLLTAQPYLLDTAAVTDRGLRRRSCCLVYRVPGIGYCGDCVLTGRGQRLRIVAAEEFADSPPL